MTTTDRKVTMIIGEPCVGKSTIMRKFLQLPTTKWLTWSHPFWVHTCREHGVAVLGRYDDHEHQFPGTDRLSMSIQPRVMDWLTYNPEWSAVLFEGDRLGNLKMARSLIDAGFDFKLVVVQTHPGVLADRREAERTQPDAFVKGRATKIANIVRGVPDHLSVVLDNNNPEDIYRASDWLWQERT